MPREARRYAVSQRACSFIAAYAARAARCRRAPPHGALRFMRQRRQRHADILSSFRFFRERR